MSSFVFMKLLETKASRYDLGMRMISWGRIGALYRAVAERVPAGCRVLEVGCGTGGVTAALLDQGCDVTAIDRSEAMLAVARDKLRTPIEDGQLQLLRLNLVQLPREFADGSFDCVVCCLVFSELSHTEQRYALDEFVRLLVPGGTVIIADEVAPRSWLRRLTYRAGRAPLAVLTYALTQTSTRPVNGIDAALATSGVQDVTAETVHGRSFQITWGRKPACRLTPQP